jgi:chromosomal replication initiator protein
MENIDYNIVDFYNSQKSNLKMLRRTLIKANLLTEDVTSLTSEKIGAKKLISLIEDVFETSVSAKNRLQNTVFARKAAAYILKNHTRLSLSEIANFIGVSDHSTVLYNIKTANDLIYTEEWYKNKIAEIEDEIKNYNIFVKN